MTAEIWNQEGRRVWEAERDDDGHRTYHLTTLVRCDSKDDGPAVVFNTPGLPAVGSYWQFGNDIDIWAFCWPTMSVKTLKKQEPNLFWEVEQTFSTKPRWRCQDTTIEDPLLEPDRVGGSFVKYTELGRFDRRGDPIANSVGDPFQGKENEWDAGRPTVWIERNDRVLGLPLFSQLIDHVNDSPMWGLPPRCVKFSQCTWSRQIFGRCNFYYTRRMEFDINFRTFDRELVDKGKRCKKGKWDFLATPPGWVADDPTDDSQGNLQFYQDGPGNVGEVLLDGNGLPLSPGSAPFKIKVEKYEEANLFLLGVPASF